MDDKTIHCILNAKQKKGGGFELMPLGFSVSSAAAFPDSETLGVHHGGHYAGAVAALNDILSCYPAYHGLSLRGLVQNADRMPSAIRRDVRNLAGSIICHEIYFSGITPGESPLKDPTLLDAILRGYGSMDNFREIFTRCANDLVGSGWVWLLRDRFDRLSIQLTHNYELPNPAVYTPILNLDCFEHAYYIRWTNKRERYVAAWFRWME